VPWRRRGLWRHRDFLVFWFGETISLLGSQITYLALPLTAILLLGASEAEMGLLAAFENLPFLVFGLLTGVWVDRVRRRRLLIGLDLVHAVAVLSVPIAAFLGVLGMPQVCLVGFIAGTMIVVRTVAYQAYLPSLVGRRRLVEANSRMETSSSVALVVGPGLGGVLVQVLSAPIAMVVDACSFLVSAAALALIRRPESRPDPARRRPIRTEIGEGLGIILRDSRLRLIMLCGATHNFFANGMIAALFVLFAVRDLGIEPAALGLLLAAAGPGVFLGAVVAGPVARRLGIGPTIAHMQTLTGVSRLVVAAAALVEPGVAFAILLLSEFLLGVARPVFNVNQLSLRQAITPHELQGRMNASIRFLMWVATPVGAVAGGVLGGILGLPSVIAIAGLGTLLAAVWLYLPPVWRLRGIPASTA
jgi:predicted MFS family arabinose efflux permease